MRNVFKYYVAYTLAQQTEAHRAQAFQRLKSDSKDGADRGESQPRRPRTVSTRLRPADEAPTPAE